MDQGWITPFVHWLGLPGLGLDVFLEAMGLPVPGETGLVAMAGLAGTGGLDIRAVFAVAFVGAVLGDNLGYLIGRRLGRPAVLRHGARVGITPVRLARVERVIDRWGPVVVVLARFVVLFRQLNGLAAGTAGMHWARFALANALGAALWVGAWSWAGYRFGAAAAAMPGLWPLLERIAWIAVPLILLGLLGGWLWRNRARATGRSRAARLDRQDDPGAGKSTEEAEPR